MIQRRRPRDRGSRDRKHRSRARVGKCRNRAAAAEHEIRSRAARGSGQRDVQGLPGLAAFERAFGCAQGDRGRGEISGQQVADAPASHLGAVSVGHDAHFSSVGVGVIGHRT